MHYLRDGLGSPALAWIYALVAGVAALTTTPIHPAQLDRGRAGERVRHPDAGSRASASPILAWLVIIGGIKSIGRAAEKLAPPKVFLYLAGGLIVIVTHIGAAARGAVPDRARGASRSGPSPAARRGSA